MWTSNFTHDYSFVIIQTELYELGKVTSGEQKYIKSQSVSQIRSSNRKPNAFLTSFQQWKLACQLVKTKIEEGELRKGKESPYTELPSTAAESSETKLPTTAATMTKAKSHIYSENEIASIMAAIQKFMDLGRDQRAMSYVDIKSKYQGEQSISLTNRHIAVH